jgi:hypothetical protein
MSNCELLQQQCGANVEEREEGVTKAKVTADVEEVIAEAASSVGRGEPTCDRRQVRQDHRVHLPWKRRQ